MKLTSILPFLAAAATAIAETHLAPFDSSNIKIGTEHEQSYEVSWVNDKNDVSVFLQIDYRHSIY